MTRTFPNAQAALFAAAAFDEYGFIIDENVWTPELAQQIANREGIDLTERHWLVLNHLRNKYQTLGGMPGIRSVCRSSGVPKHEVQRLFDSCVNVWKIAGLVDPGEEARNYMA